MSHSLVRFLRAACLSVSLSLCLSATAQSQTPAISGTSQIKWQSYTFNMVRNGRSGRIYDETGKEVGRIVTLRNDPQLITLISGPDEAKLKTSFAAWKAAGGVGAQANPTENASPAAIHTPATSSPDSPTPGPAVTSANPATPGLHSVPSTLSAKGQVIGGATFRTIKSPEVAASLKLSNTGIFDLNLLQAHPEFLESEQILRYFVALNNCIVQLPGEPLYAEDNQIKKVMNNELDYPTVAAYYKAHATEILSNIPRVIELNIGSSHLLDYDQAQHVFPIGEKMGRNPKMGLVLPRMSGIDAGPSLYHSMISLCFEASTIRGNLSTAGSLPAQYVMDIGEAYTFSQVPMDLSMAHQYIDAVGQDRTITFDAEYVLPSSPKIERVSCGPGTLQKATCAMFPAKLQKVTVSKLHPRPQPAGSKTPEPPLAVVYP